MPATRRRGRSAACSAARSAVWSAYFTGVLGAGQKQPAQQPAANGSKQSGSTKAAKAAKGEKPGKQPAVLTQNGEPVLTAEQIVSNSDANIERIKAELELTPDQEKNWSAFNSAMHYLGHNGADRLNLRIARAKRDPPDDIIEQMRNEAQFLDDRAADQRAVADGADPLLCEPQRQAEADLHRRDGAPEPRARARLRRNGAK